VSGTSNRLSSVSGALVRSYSYDPSGNSLTTGATLAAGLILSGHVECNNCIWSTLASGRDFFNPFSAPQDLIDTYDALTEDDD
jgi:hypothetical protein